MYVCMYVCIKILKLGLNKIKLGHFFFKKGWARTSKIYLKIFLHWVGLRLSKDTLILM